MEPISYYDDECELDDIDVCMGCGRYYGWRSLQAVTAWDRSHGVAPQLCLKCWREGGYPMKEQAHQMSQREAG